MTNYELIKSHDESTIFCSFQQHMRESSATYKEIISKGQEIVPDILKYLIDEGGGMNIMLLLWDITGENPYHPEPIGDTGWGAYNVDDAVDAWIDWGNKNIKKKKINIKNLTVGELIEVLKNYDENLFVVVTDEGKGHQYSLVESGISIIEGGYFGNDSNTTQELEEKELFLNLGNF